MFVRKKKYPSGNIGVIVVEKIGGNMKELVTIGVAYMHLLCGFESIQGIGAHAESLRD